MRFVRCKGREYCLEGEQGCRTCGRSHAEMEGTRGLIGAVAGFVIDQGYENEEEFVTFVAEKALKAIRHRREAAVPAEV